jgi:hypothetical protein
VIRTTREVIGDCGRCGEKQYREKGEMESFDRSLSDEWTVEPYDLVRCGCGIIWMDLPVRNLRYEASN